MYGGYHHPYGGFPGGGYQQLGNFGYGGGYPYSYAGNAMVSRFDLVLIEDDL